MLRILFSLVIFSWAARTSGENTISEENGSTISLSWHTNMSLGLSDRMRTYGNGFYLTAAEESALDKLRPLVEHMALLPFHKRDNYLIKFLRARNLNVAAAADMLNAAMDWRRERDLDRLLNTDYTKWEKLFPFILTGQDKNNGPVYYILASSYDVRKSIIGGHYQTLIDLFDRSFELGVRAGVAIYEMTGKNAGIQGTLILDLAGFNLKQHGCARCLAVYIHVVTAYERYWPQLLRKLFVVNAPRSFQVVLDAVRPFISRASAEALDVFGVDKNEWEPVLRQYIEDGELLVRYGGTRKLRTLATQTFGG